VLVVSSPGYQERSIKAKTVKGHKLIASVQLAREQEQPETPDEDEPDEDEDEAKESTTSAKASPKPSPKPTPKSSPTSGETPDRPYIEITSEVGWARVREEATTGSEELTTVDLGEKFPLLDTSSDGWYQIEYEPGKQGWISGSLAEKYE